MARVRILVPMLAGNRGSAGDVIEVSSDELPILVGSGAVEETDEELGEFREPEPVFPEPVPEGSEPQWGPSTATEEGANIPFEPLPVGQPAPGAEAPEQSTDAEGNVLDQQVQYTGEGEAGEHEEVETPTQQEVAEGAELEGGEAGEADTGTGRYEDRTVDQLKAVAASRGLPTSGTKAELIERLRG